MLSKSHLLDHMWQYCLCNDNKESWLLDIEAEMNVFSVK